MPDVHLVSLQPSLEGLIVPSKFYGIAAAGRPTIFIGARLGEIPRLLRKFDCGAVVEIGDSVSLSQNIKTLQNETKQRVSWGENARALFVQRFDRPHAIGQWVCVLDSITAPNNGAAADDFRECSR
jgi:glycosyltransferase involved in cell wall biosynthesis